jgi:lipid-A-disaccharide synthase
MPNILAKRRIVPELIQDDVNRDNIISALMPLILNETTYVETRTALGEVSRLLGNTGVIERISRLLESDLFPQDNPSPAELGVSREHRPRQE